MFGIGEAASGLLGSAGKALPGIGTVVSGGMDYVSAQKEQGDLQKFFGKSALKQLRRDPAIRRAMEARDDKWEGSVLGSIASIAGGAAVGALLGVFTLNPVIGFIGSIAGGFGGSYLYNKAFENDVQDPLMIAFQIGKMRESGEAVSPEVVFAALAANLPERDAKRVDKKLKKLTGETLFTEALSKQENMQKLIAMMNDDVIDDAIRAQTGMPPDPQNPKKSVAEQYAELINSGQMDPKAMLKHGEGMYALAAATQQQQQSVNVPVTPETGRHSVGRTT